MTHFITDNIKEFPQALFCPKQKIMRGKAYEDAMIALEAHGTRPAPERVSILAKLGPGKKSRDILDQAFELSESVVIPKEPETMGFDPGSPRLGCEEVAEALKQVPENRNWIISALGRAARRYDLSLSNDPLDSAEKLLTYLCQKVSYWEADAFPLDAMMDLKNRYDWTFCTDAWSLREQLRREAMVISNAWTNLFAMSARSPVLVILNETTPTDYFTCYLPSGASVVANEHIASYYTPSVIRDGDNPIILYTGLKISSSEHRESLENSPEGEAFEKAVNFALKTGRHPVLLDFSRRRFPRSFMRVNYFTNQNGWGIDPKGKVCDPEATGIPSSKSSRGFAPKHGSPVITLFDPWPVSDAQVVAGLTQGEKEAFCKLPNTKPWQDDRIGARTEMNANKNGVYQVTAQAWVVPALGGWMRADELFRSRLSRLLTIDY